MTLLGGTMLTGCASENPFDTEGEGVLRMNMVINTDVTRAESDPDDLRAGCVVYISGPQGLVHKFKGLENVPEAIHLKTGHYVAEAWTGDSVPASFTSKFFRGYQPFDLSRGENRVVVNCQIANTIVSVNNATIDPDLMKDWSITVTNAGSSLTFDEANVATDKAYFMLASTTTELQYEVKGTNMHGDPFVKTGVIASPKRTHEYVLNMAYNPSYEEEGGAFLNVIIDEREVVVNGEVIIYGRPVIQGSDFDIDRQIVAEPGAFTSEKVIKVSGFNGLRSVEISTADAADMRLPQSRFDLRNLTEAAAGAINAAGLTWDYSINEKDIATSYIHLSRQWLNSLPERATEYRLNVAVTDLQGKRTEAVVRLAVGEDAVVIEDPVTVAAIDPSDLLAVGSHRATLSASLMDESATNPGIQYRESAGGDWAFAPLTHTRAKGTPAVVTLTGLKASTRYEYRAVADGFAGESMYFTTEGCFEIPNSSMEEWSSFSDNSKVLLPGAGGKRTFWDSGNHGSATMNVTLTQSDATMKHSGEKGARLRSQFVGIGIAGKFAAGNLFAGTYLETQGTDGRLEFGRPYDGSHPSALSLWVNYRPGKVEKKGDYLQVGDMDKGQIYVALSTEPVEVRTKKSNQKLFSKDDACIVAYGQYTFDEAFGPDGELTRLSIPIEYYDKAKTTRPLYLIIVCSASYYGDYFNGGEGSVMYVDDFTLEYE